MTSLWEGGLDGPGAAMGVLVEAPPPFPDPADGVVQASSLETRLSGLDLLWLVGPVSGATSAAPWSAGALAGAAKPSWSAPLAHAPPGRTRPVTPRMPRLSEPGVPPSVSRCYRSPSPWCGGEIFDPGRRRAWLARAAELDGDLAAQRPTLEALEAALEREAGQASCTAPPRTGQCHVPQRRPERPRNAERPELGVARSAPWGAGEVACTDLGLASGPGVPTHGEPKAGVSLRARAVVASARCGEAAVVQKLAEIMQQETRCHSRAAAVRTVLGPGTPIGGRARKRTLSPQDRIASASFPIQSLTARHAHEADRRSEAVASARGFRRKKGLSKEEQEKAIGRKKALEIITGMHERHVAIEAGMVLASRNREEEQRAEEENFARRLRGSVLNECTIEAAEDESNNRVRITIVRASALKSGVEGVQGPVYCTCHIPTRKHARLKTPMVEENRDWNHTQELWQWREGEKLTFTVWEKGLGEHADEMIGQMTLPGSMFTPSYAGEIQLSKSHGARNTGLLEVKINILSGDGD